MISIKGILFYFLGFIIIFALFFGAVWYGTSKNVWNAGQPKRAVR